MELMKYSKIFALAAVLALVVGCSGDANTQEEASEEVVAEEVHADDAPVAEGAGLDEDATATALTSELEAVLPAISTVYFDFDKSNIRSEFYDVLNGHAAYLKANPRAKVTLEGHTDVRGSAEYNMALGERRGNSVQRYLSLQGVAASQMEVVSYGKMQLAAQGDSREAHSQNRRVELNY